MRMKAVCSIYLAKGCWEMSRRDRVIVARHEAQETRRTFRGGIPLGLAAPDHTVPYGTVLSRDAFPGTSCQATIGVVPPGRAFIEELGVSRLLMTFNSIHLSRAVAITSLQSLVNLSCRHGRLLRRVRERTRRVFTTLS
jgi:hypothetical protein